jgi:hypothetical protein
MLPPPLHTVTRYFVVINPSLSRLTPKVENVTRLTFGNVAQILPRTVAGSFKFRECCAVPGRDASERSSRNKLSKQAIIQQPCDQAAAAKGTNRSQTLEEVGYKVGYVTLMVIASREHTIDWQASWQAKRKDKISRLAVSTVQWRALIN